MKNKFINTLLLFSASIAILYAPLNAHCSTYKVQKASASTSTNTLSKADYDKFTTQITTYLNNGKFNDSLKACNDLISKYPKASDLYYWKSVSLYNLGKYIDGEKAIDSAISMNATKASYYEMKAKNNYYSSKYNADTTLVTSETAISLNPDSYAGYLFRARAMHDSSEKGYTDSYDTAVNICNKLLKSSKSTYDNIDILRAKASCFYDLGLYSEYINIYLQCIASNPNSFVLYRQLAYGYSEIDDYGHSIQYFNKASKLNYNDPETFEGLGNAYLNLNQADTAIFYFKKLIALKPDYADGYNDLGDCYDEKGLESIADQYYDKAKTIAAKSSKSKGTKI